MKSNHQSPKNLSSSPIHSDVATRSTSQKMSLVVDTDQGGKVGRPLKEIPTLYLPKERRDRTAKIWYYTYKGENKSTGCTSRRDAWQVALREQDKYESLQNKPSVASSVTVGEVLKFFLDQSILLEDIYLVLIKNWIAHLRPFWQKIKVTSINPKRHGDEYCQYRRTQIRTNAERGASNSALRPEIDCLNKALRAFRKENPNFHLPEVMVDKPPRDPAREVWLTRDEIARLCRAARGRVWDSETGGWRRHPATTVGERGLLVLKSSEWRKRMRVMIRFILIALYTGSRSGVVLVAQWIAGPDHGYFEVAQSLFHRRGWNEIESSKERPEIKVPRQLDVLLKLWKKNDMKGYDIITGDVAFSPTSIVVHREGLSLPDYVGNWHKIRIAAGLGPEMIPHTLRHSAANWLIEGGATIKQAADYLGVDVPTFKGTYLQWAPQFATEAALAMDPRRYNPHRNANLFGAIEDGPEPPSS